uniref:Hexosyltransferase n=1 Tax=Ascaris suum TaxID=6253 RepID=F1LDN7_ASCSU
MIPMRVNNLHAVSLLLLVILFWIIVICGFFYQTSMTEKSDSRIVIAKKLIRRHPGLTIREHINNRSDKKEASDQLDFEKQFERNLGLMWIRFVAEYCPKVPFIMKLDDDVAVNYIAVLRFLTIRVRRKLLPNKRLTMCRLMDGSPAIRDKNNKWYISSAEYPNDVFSAYCSGLAFIITSDLIRPMMKEAQKSKLIWVDDFFLTGYILPRTQASLSRILDRYMR